MMLFKFSFIYVGFISCFVNAFQYLQQPANITLTGEGGEITLYVRENLEHIRDRNGDIIATVKLRSFCVDEVSDCKYFGPTIYARPGQLMNITLVNLLYGVGRLSKILELPHLQGYKDPDVVNLHTHGLHVSPGVDNVGLWTSPRCPPWLVQANNYSKELLYHYDCVFSEAYGFDATEAGTSNTQNYPYQLPVHHYPGTHWYHAHWHGSTAFQMQQGLMGMIIIEETDERYIPDMEDVLLMVSFAWLHNDTQCMEMTDNFDLDKNCPKDNLMFSRPAGSSPYPFNFPVQSACYIYCKMAVEMNSPKTANLPRIPVPWRGNTVTNYTQYQLSDTRYNVRMEVPLPEPNAGVDFFFVNGLVQPVQNISSTKWYRFRLVNTFMDYLFFYYPSIEPYEDICQVYVLGQDGINFEDGPRDLLDPASGYVNNTVVVQPGARADIAIQCDYTGEDWREVPIISTTADNPLYPHLGFAPTLRTNKVLMWLLINDDGEMTAERKNISNVYKARPYTDTPYLQRTNELEEGEFSALCSTADPGWNAGNNSQCNIMLERQKFTSSGNGAVAVNNIQFTDNKYLMEVCVGGNDTSQVHEWTVTTNYHPFHHHTWPFQLQDDVADGWIARKGDWRDTMGASGTFRIRANYYVDEALQWDRSPSAAPVALITHCHYVPHEDHGMMAAIGMTQMNENGTCPNAGKYIVPPETTLTSKPLINVIAIESEAGKVLNCSRRHALSKIFMNDVNTNLTVMLNIMPDCSLNFTFRLSPRTISIGNAWIGVAFNPTGYDISNDSCSEEADAYCWNKFPMTGAGFVVGLQATDDGPMAIATATEVDLFTYYVNESSNTYRYLSCDGNVYYEDGEARFSCIRYVFDDDDAYKTHFRFDDDEVAHQEAFVWAYGEGQFKMTQTYHSSRSGCAFNFLSNNVWEVAGVDDVDVINCTHSQNRVSFSLPLTDAPTRAPTLAPTVTTTEENESGAPLFVCLPLFSLITANFL
mmetsp:Transcript_26700/g.43696  ORF Transcript_26700/g.43696 Transcript_26700/m.43696 type:complete len:984 (-) Transcript_26700:35-2986(-)